MHSSILGLGNWPPVQSIGSKESDTTEPITLSLSKSSQGEHFLLAYEGEVLEGMLLERLC